MGGLTDAGIWGVAWAMFAAAAGFGLTVAAIAFSPIEDENGEDEFAVGYNALAPTTDP